MAFAFLGCAACDESPTRAQSGLEDAASALDAAQSRDVGLNVDGGSGDRLAETFTIEVVSSENAMASYSLNALGLEVGSVPTRLVSRLPWVSQERASYELVSSFRAQVVDSKTVQPYLCPLYTDFEAKLAAGWTFQEFHQVHLRDDGELDIGTDIDQPLHFWCNVKPPGAPANYGSGIGSVSDSPPLCANADRDDTAIRLSGTVGDDRIDAPPETCLVVSRSSGNAELVLQFGFTRDAEHLEAVLKHCVGPNDTYPLSLTTSSAGCSFSGVIGLFDPASGRAHVDATEGTWTIDEANVAERGGRVRGSVDLVFSDGQSSATLTGTFDLPVLRL